MAELGEWLTSINTSKGDIITGSDDPIETEKSYNPYIINHLLANFIDAVMPTNEMNKYPLLDKKMQYDFLVHSLRPKKRFSKWIKPEAVEDLESIKEYYNYNNRKAKDALKILSSEQVSEIKEKLYKGGMGKKKKS